MVFPVTLVAVVPTSPFIVRLPLPKVPEKLDWSPSIIIALLIPLKSEPGSKVDRVIVPVPPMVFPVTLAAVVPTLPFIVRLPLPKLPVKLDWEALIVTAVLIPLKSEPASKVDMMTLPSPPTVVPWSCADSTVTVFPAATVIFFITEKFVIPLISTFSVKLAVNLAEWSIILLKL